MSTREVALFALLHSSQRRVGVLNCKPPTVSYCKHLYHRKAVERFTKSNTVYTPLLDNVKSTRFSINNRFFSFRNFTDILNDVSGKTMAGKKTFV